MPELDALVAAWSASTRTAIDEAYSAGLDSQAEAPDSLVAELITTLVTPLHARIVASFDETDDREELATRLGARYREWRAQELDEAVRELVAIAHVRGVFDAAPERAELRWVPARPGGCSDCDDNALEPVERGKRFPTGQVAPPAHRGCRCLLVVA
jgi:hypothetical protein